MKQKLLDIYDIKTKLDTKEILETYSAYGARLKEYITTTHIELNSAIQKKKNILLEGAQGTMLDVDFGTYPYTTSSSTIAGGCAIGAGIGPRCVDEIIGLNGNISEDPLFCDPVAADYTLSEDSPCVGSGTGGSNIGAYGVGCGPQSWVGDHPLTWGIIKTLYR